MRFWILSSILLISIHGNSAKIDGNWGDWLAWGTCSVTCLTGTRLRTRACDNPPPSNGGLDCVGDGSESMSCIIMNYCLPSYNGNKDLNCTSDQFGCATGIVQCLNITLRCDDQIDCEDGSDENPYFTGCLEKYCSAAYNFTPSIILVVMVFAVAQLITSTNSVFIF